MPNDHLQDHLISRLPELKGSFVRKNSSYESELAEAAAVTLDERRYWDATWRDQALEFKKGRSIWIDLVRVAESVLKIDEEASRPTTTLFFLPDKSREYIAEVVSVRTQRLSKYLQIDEATARTLLRLNDTVPRSLNAQARITVSDARLLSNFTVKRPDE